MSKNPGKSAQTTTTANTDVVKTAVDGLSFVTETRTKRGRFIEANFFDITPTTDVFHEAGTEAFLELMRAIKGGKDLGISTRHIVVAAALATRDSPRGITQCWEGYQFMNLVHEAVRFFAMNADWEPFIQERLESANACKARYEQEERDRMAELTRKSVEARRQRKLEDGFSTLLSSGKTIPLEVAA